MIAFRKNRQNKPEVLNAKSETIRTAVDTDAVLVDRETIRKLSQVCEKMLCGDMDARVIGLPAGHPLEFLAQTINGTLDLMDAYTRESATAIEFCSKDQFYRPLLPQGLPGVFQQAANTINSGGLRMRDSYQRFSEISELADENSQEVTTVAAACEELSATNQEITKQAQMTVEHSHATASLAHELHGSVENMGTALSAINSTVTMIENIADQTHLLALNAMIEASRAGGKGSRFEVVANEVKELAQRTSVATEQIKKHVANFHQIANQTSESFEKIETSIEGIEASAKNISSSLMHQEAATQEVTTSISEVAANMDSVSEKIRSSRGNPARS